MKPWSEAATKAQEAFKRADLSALAGDPEKALIQLAECKAWIEIAMFRIAAEVR